MGEIVEYLPCRWCGAAPDAPQHNVEPSPDSPGGWRLKWPWPRGTPLADKMPPVSHEYEAPRVAG